MSERDQVLADFGLTVTIGIAAITIPDGHIVTVSDRMLSNADDVLPADDNAAIKTLTISQKWAVLFAATNANLFLPIIGRCKERLAANGTDHDLATVQDVVVKVYREMFDQEFSGSCLARYGFSSITEFRENGLVQFGRRKFNDICDEIEDFDLGIDLVVYGFGPDNQPHLFEVSNPGNVTDQELLGYAVVGSGFYMALASLRRKPLPRSLERTIYRLLEAKFSAETAAGVGKTTTVLTMNCKGELGTMTKDEISKVREIWERTLREPDPADAVDIIKETGAVGNISDDGSTPTT